MTDKEKKQKKPDYEWCPHCGERLIPTYAECEYCHEQIIKITEDAA